MKKLLLVLAIVLANSLFAQDSKTGVFLTLKGGLTYANMYGKDVRSFAFLRERKKFHPGTFYTSMDGSDVFKAGINTGIQVDFRVLKHFSFGIGFGYIQKGAKINDLRIWNEELEIPEYLDGELTWKQNFWIIDIPLIVYIPINKDEIYLKSGLRYGYNINSVEEGSFEYRETVYTHEDNKEKNDKEPGFFLAFGYSYALPKNFGNLLLEFEWNRSTSKSLGHGMVGGPIPQYYNQTVSINIGYKHKIKFGKKNRL